MVNPRTEKARGVDLRVPESRVYQEKEPEIVGIPRKLACVHTICVKELWKVVMCHTREKVIGEKELKME